MNNDLGPFLRALRKERGWTQAQAAEATGIARATLNRWETGGHEPRLTELEALLSILQATARQKQQALGRMNAPRAQAQVRQTIARIGEQVGLGKMPNGGDLLQALRSRQQLSLEVAAERLGVTTRTLRRWEKMEVWPSVEQLQTLCYVLKAQEEEVIALTCRQFSQTAQSTSIPPALDALEQRWQELHRQVMSGEWALLNLNFLTLEGQAWTLATRDAQARRLLAQIYTTHASYLDYGGDWIASAQMAQRSLDLLPPHSAPEHFWLRAAVLSCKNMFVPGGANPRRALRMLRHWLPLSSPWPDMQAWIFSNMAVCMAWGASQDAALNVAAEGCHVAQRCEDPGELERRKYSQAEVLLDIGCPAGALALLDEVKTDTFVFNSQMMLRRTEAHIALNELSEAQDWLQRAMSVIETHSMLHLHDQAAKLALRF